MLVELGLVEQRYKAVLEVLNDGVTVTEVARRHGEGGPGGGIPHFLSRHSSSGRTHPDDKRTHVRLRWRR